MDIPSYLLGKANGGGGGGGTTNYNELSNKPSINGVTLSGNKTLSELGVEGQVLFYNIQAMTAQAVSPIITEAYSKNATVFLSVGNMSNSTYICTINAKNEGYNFDRLDYPLITQNDSNITIYRRYSVRGSWSEDTYTAVQVTPVSASAKKSISNR